MPGTAMSWRQLLSSVCSCLSLRFFAAGDVFSAQTSLQCLESRLTECLQTFMKASPENKVIGSGQITVSYGEYKDYQCH